MEKRLRNGRMVGNREEARPHPNLLPQEKEWLFQRRSRFQAAAMGERLSRVKDACHVEVLSRGERI